MMIVDFSNETDFCADKYYEQLEKVCAITLETEQFPKEAEISILFVGDEQIKELNLKHRGINSETDVLSFPVYVFTCGKFESIANNREPVSLGDIVISVERALAQADKYNHTVLRELAFLVTHSMLHLLGYDHETDSDSKDMFEKQDIILNIAGISR